ncbi:flagellar protein FliT [Halomonas campaniensis]|uniref:Flagellar protein FliT n=1 Tax=Halomonas campaniensis TaxID=213554 RepID=A0A7W5P9L3_9GAMM|nr:flagellar protein FliT [Halomonas campaniensis]MBB3329735.1 flagellar protein FliT [Halomonas campaniensis]
MPAQVPPRDDCTRQDVLVGAYESLLERSTRMLATVRAADWDGLVDQETQYVVQVERLSRLDAEQPLDDRRAARKAALLERILEQDLEIRQRLIERRDELDRLIGSSRKQLALSRAYGPQQGGATTIQAEQRFAKKVP